MDILEMSNFVLWLNNLLELVQTSLNYQVQWSTCNISTLQEQFEKFMWLAWILVFAVIGLWLNVCVHMF